MAGVGPVTVTLAEAPGTSAYARPLTMGMRASLPNTCLVVSFLTSACAGTSTSEVSHFVNASGLPSRLFKGFVPDNSLRSFFVRSAINLGFTRMVGDDPDVAGITQIKLRDFEVPLAGGFYLVERAPGYEEFFGLGTEVETWDTPHALLEKVRYYLDHPEERKAIATAGQRRAEREHTWRHRFEQLFADLGIGGHPGTMTGAREA